MLTHLKKIQMQKVMICQVRLHSWGAKTSGKPDRAAPVAQPITIISHSYHHDDDGDGDANDDANSDGDGDGNGNGDGDDDGDGEEEDDDEADRH